MPWSKEQKLSMCVLWTLMLLWFLQVYSMIYLWFNLWLTSGWLLAWAKSTDFAISIAYVKVWVRTSLGHCWCSMPIQGVIQHLLSVGRVRSQFGWPGKPMMKPLKYSICFPCQKSIPKMRCCFMAVPKAWETDCHLVWQVQSFNWHHPKYSAAAHQTGSLSDSNLGDQHILTARYSFSKGLWMDQVIGVMGTSLVDTSRSPHSLQRTY